MPKKYLAIKPFLSIFFASHNRPKFHAIELRTHGCCAKSIDMGTDLPKCSKQTAGKHRGIGRHKLLSLRRRASESLENCYFYTVILGETDENFVKSTYSAMECAAHPFGSGVHAALACFHANAVFALFRLELVTIPIPPPPSPLPLSHVFSLPLPKCGKSLRYYAFTCFMINWNLFLLLIILYRNKA